MCEIDSTNFIDKLPELKTTFSKAKFLAIDLEFSGLQSTTSQTPSLFDTPRERYEKLRNNLQYIIPLQVGITAFHYDGNTNDYLGEVFNFHVIPAAFDNVDKKFVFQSSSINFLCTHNFDFNKIKDRYDLESDYGIPYITRTDEEMLLKKLKEGALLADESSFNLEFNEAIKYFIPAIEIWYSKSQTGDHLEIPEITKRYGKYYQLLYSLQKYFRNRFVNVWTYIKNDCFYVKRVTHDEYIKLCHEYKLEEEFVKEVIGFRAIFAYLTALKKPIVGHNLFNDLMVMYHCFEESLPKSYREFKEKIHDLFPIIFDTKTLYYELRRSIPRTKEAEGNSLQVLYTYFKDGYGRHLGNNLTTILSNITEENLDRYHEAGWDSFCTGYIFLRMGFYKLQQLYPKRNMFVCSEVFGSLSEYKNVINVIRGTTNNMVLDGKDPTTNRPPWLVVESKKNKAINLQNLTAELRTFGPIDIRMSGSNDRSVFLAVNSERTAQEIFQSLRDSEKYQVKKYSILKHSVKFRTCLVSSLAVCALLYLFKSYKRDKILFTIPQQSILILKR